MLRHSLAFFVVASLMACGPQGTINGKVTMQGGSAAGVAVFLYGPLNGATATASDGSFTFEAVPDGDYVLRAVIRGADVEEITVATTVSGGSASPEPTLAFRASNATVSGRVVFTDGSDASGLAVVAQGPQTASATTGADGSFSFANLKNGAYVVSVEVRDTREGKVGIGVDTATSGDVGELRLTPVGRLTGTVTYGGAPAQGVQVLVPGTGVDAVTDAAGAFELVNVPTGAATVWARTGTSPFWRSGSQTVTVVRGANPAVAVEITDDPPPTGTVKGVVTFHRAQSPTHITVQVDGLDDVTVPVSASGGFSLDVPVGSWNIVATAPSHPKLILGHVNIHEGETITLPGRQLSWYRTLWQSEGPITALTSAGPGAGLSPWSLLNIETDSTLTRLAAVNPSTGELRFLTTSPVTNPRVSYTGKFITWYNAQAVYVYETSSGILRPYTFPNTVYGVSVFQDERAILVMLGLSYYFMRIDVPSFATERIPAGSGTYAGADFSPLSAYGYNGSNWTQVTSTSVGTMTLTAQFNLYGYLEGYFDSGATSALRILSPAGSLVELDGFPTGTTFSSLLTGEIPCVRASTGESFCVRLSDGQRFDLPSNTQSIRVNSAGNRMALYADTGPYSLYEMPFPPPATLPAAIESSPNAWTMGWISPTRVVATSLDGTTKARIITAGIAGPLMTDIVTSLLTPPLFRVRHTPAPDTWRMWLGDGPERTLTVPPGVGLNSVVRPWGGAEGDSPTKYAALIAATSPLSTVYFLNETASAIQEWGYGNCTSALRSGTAELVACIPSLETTILAWDYQHRLLIDISDNTGVGGGSGVGNQAKTYGAVRVANDGHGLQLGVFGP